MWFLTVKTFNGEDSACRPHFDDCLGALLKNFAREAEEIMLDERRRMGKDAKNDTESKVRAMPPSTDANTACPIQPVAGREAKVERSRTWACIKIAVFA